MVLSAFRLGNILLNHIQRFLKVLFRRIACYCAVNPYVAIVTDWQTLADVGGHRYPLLVLFGRLPGPIKYHPSHFVSPPSHQRPH